MSKFQKYVVNAAIIDLILSFIAAIVVFRIERVFLIKISFFPVAFAVLIISLMGAGAIALFQNEKLPTALRVIFGYGLVFLSTLVVRRVLGIWIFRRTFALFLFISGCTIVYFLVVFLISLNNKLEQNDLNQALKKIDLSPEEPQEKTE